ncbi:MAG: tyrosine--tRNA ligase, partial [Rhodospirillaceae bacterium]
ANEAAETARRTFEDGDAGDSLPTIDVSSADLDKGMSILSLFHKAGLAASNGEARRLIRGGGAKLNDEKVDDENLQVSAVFVRDGCIKISAGKKRHAIVRVS